MEKCIIRDRFRVLMFWELTKVNKTSDSTNTKTILIRHATEGVKECSIYNGNMEVQGREAAVRAGRY